MGLEEKSYENENRIIEVQYFRKMLELEPVSSVSEPCCLTPCAMGPIGISDESVTDIIIIHGPRN